VGHLQLKIQVFTLPPCHYLRLLPPLSPHLLQLLCS
jgi:hypothetical protein